MEVAENTCLVCHEAIDIFAIGQCDHPICFKCSTRMRALCEQFYCPICRTDLPEVFFMLKKEKFGEMPMRKFVLNRKLKIQFENDSIRTRFEELLEHRCTICKDRYPEKTFKSLQDHMRRVHTLFYCGLCLSLKIFTRERKVYNRQGLASHRRVGDKDDTSYKGHPLCQFCDERYLDKDELYKHLRKDHYYCHFCESLGSQEFFSDYEVLKNHFRSGHYLCEEGECATIEFETAFRSEIDLKGHRATHHSKAQSKLQSRQERIINIDINLVPRPSNRGRGVTNRNDYEDVRNSGPRHQGSRGGRHGGRTSDREKNDVERAIQASLSTMKDETKKKTQPATKKSDSSSDDDFVHHDDNFPTLSGKVVSKPPSTTSTSTAVTEPSKSSLADRFAISHSMSVQHGVLGLGDFPTLNQNSSSTDSAVSSTGRISPYKPAFSAKKVEEDFPGLPASAKPSISMSRSWVQSGKANVKGKPVSSGSSSAVTKKSAKVNRPPSASGKTGYSDSDFPSLGGPSNASSSSNMKWFKSGKDNQFSKHAKSNNVPVPSNAVNDDINIIDRYSPVNIPDSPKNEQKTKNKKKKKKEKVNNESNNLAVKKDVLKGNSSLDDIASLLLTSATISSAAEKEPRINEQRKQFSGQPDAKSVGKSVAKPVTVQPDKPKEKKKEDKIEKRFEHTKEEISNDFEREIKVPPVKFTIAEEEFPSLGAPAKGKKPPPGFKKESGPPSLTSPPGFSKPAGNKPPPGFSLQSTGMSLQSQTTNCNVGEVISTSANLKNFQYSQPEGFNDRNRSLIAIIQSCCEHDPTKFPDFRLLSGDFRKSEISADQYYKRCEEVLGKDKFAEIFPELLALLPDIGKQQDLLSVYMMSDSMKIDEDVLKISGKSRKAKGAWTQSASGFLTCQTCNQVLIRKDYNAHGAVHNLDSDFPVLGNEVNGANQGFSSGSWLKAK